MKRLFISLLAVFYLSVSFGANIDMHYCMGELVQWDINAHEAETQDICDNCGMDAGLTENCCKSESKQLKLDADQKITKSDFKIKLPGFGQSPLVPFTGVALRYGSSTASLNKYHSPPPAPSRAAFLLYRNFRI